MLKTLALIFVIAIPMLEPAATSQRIRTIVMAPLGEGGGGGGTSSSEVVSEDKKNEIKKKIEGTYGASEPLRTLKYSCVPRTGLNAVGVVISQTKDKDTIKNLELDLTPCASDEKEIICFREPLTIEKATDKKCGNRTYAQVHAEQK